MLVTPAKSSSSFKHHSHGKQHTLMSLKPITPPYLKIHTYFNTHVLSFSHEFVGTPPMQCYSTRPSTLPYSMYTAMINYTDVAHYLDVCSASRCSW
jgi:hypothetical protein